jgi:small subunit ribosomal protein S16
MVKIILSRTGKPKMPLFRVIVVDKLKDPWGRALEIIGTYNPRAKDFKIKFDRYEYWVSKGAQPSATLSNLLITNKLIEGKKQNITHISKRHTVRLTAKKDKEAAELAKKAAAEVENKQ